MDPVTFTLAARLKLDAVEIVASDFTLSVPEGAIGARLDADLAAFDADVTGAEEVKFEIGIGAGGPIDYGTYLDVGSILDLEQLSAMVNSRVRIGGINPLASKWELAPVVPIILYDPDRVTLPTASQSVQGNVIDEDGEPITPDIISRPDYDLAQLLNFVYVEKLGFTEVITNIDSYPIKQSTFALSASYHSVALQQIQLFQPVYETTEDGTLFIYDPQGTLPTGIDVRPIRAYDRLTVQQQSSQIVTAVLLSYRDNTVADISAGSVTDRIDTTEQQVGTFGETGWQRTIKREYIKEFHDNPSDPALITREVIWKIDTRTYAFVGVVRETIIETQEDQYDFDYRLKVGYTKVTELLSKIPGNDTPLMREAQREVNQIVYQTAGSDPNEQIKFSDTLSITGTIFVTDNPDDPENPFKVSLYEANRTDNIPDDADVQLGKPIKTTVELWREIGPDQIEDNLTVFDHLTGKVEQNKTIQHTGTIRVRTGDPERTVTMLIRNAAAEATFGTRTPFGLDAGEIPFEQAKDLADRILERQGALPATASITLTGLDLSLRRGSIRDVVDSKGNTLRIFVRGYQIKGQNLGSRDFSYEQSLTGWVLPAE